MFKTSADKSALDSPDTKMLKPFLPLLINCLSHRHSMRASSHKWSIKTMSYLHIYNTRASTNFKVHKINQFHSRTPGNYIKYCRTSKTPDPELIFLSFKVLIGSNNTSNPICTSKDHSKLALTSKLVRCLTIRSLKVILKLLRDFNNLNKQLRTNLTNLSVKIICSDPCNPNFRKSPISIPNNLFRWVCSVSSA